MGYAYPIDSKVVTNPNGTIDYDRASSSAQLRGLIKSMITNGVNLTESTNLQVMAEGETMNVVVKPGFAIIEGAVKQFEDDVKITISNADETNPRIDTIVARLNLNDEVRDMVIDIIQGTPSEEPEAPTLSQNTSTYYEIGLADILVEVGATQISQEVITDTRLLNSRCGLATSIGEIDTETLFLQLTLDFQNWFHEIQGKLSEDVAGSMQLQIDDLTGFELEGVLLAGETTIELSDIRITENSILDVVYTSIFGVQLYSAEFSAGSLLLEFPVQETDLNVKVVIK